MKQNKAKKVLKIIGLCLLFVAVVAGLLYATVFVYAHVESQNYKRDITEQVREFNDKGKSESGEAVRLKVVPLGDLINPEYSKIKSLEGDYVELYNGFAKYYTNKADYEAKTKAYNEARANGENPEGGDELSTQHDELEKTMEELNKSIEDLKNKFNNL